MRSARTRKRTRATRRRAPKAILLIQFDSEKLARDRLDLVPFAQAAQLLADKASLTIVSATTQDDLHTQLAALFGKTFDVIATIGHSNERGIRIASDVAISWDAYAEYLKPFEPRRLAIVACRAGRATPIGRIFTRLPKLRRIFATPALANRRQGAAMVLLLPYLLDHKVPDRDLLRLLQVGLALDGRQMWEWRRAEWLRMKDDVLTPVLHDLLERAGAALVGAVSGRAPRR